MSSPCFRSVLLCKTSSYHFRPENGLFFHNISLFTGGCLLWYSTKTEKGNLRGISYSDALHENSVLQICPESFFISTICAHSATCLVRNVSHENNSTNLQVSPHCRGFNCCVTVGVLIANRNVE